jgi:ribosomal protein L13
MRTDYYFSVDGVWSAVEKTIADMKGRDVEPDKQTDGGTIVAVINDEKVTFKLKYKDKDLTSLGIRVGVMGNEAASKVIHDRVADNLLKK